ncbi:hypothetical protein GQ457_13G009670 [Hibiscus cannabinus]
MFMQEYKSSQHRDTPPPHFHNTMVTAFTFSLASSIFMVTNSRGFDSPHWIDFDAFSLGDLHRRHSLP